MGGGSSKPKRFKVSVNVYDLASDSTNQFVSTFLGGGLHHSGIQIQNTEYAFGGGGSGSGVWSQRPREIPQNLADKGNVPKFSRVHELGVVSISIRDLNKLLASLRSEYPSSRYSLLQCNWNHFTKDVCTRLGLDAPELDYLNKAANAGSSILQFGLGLMSAMSNMLEQNNHLLNNGSVNGNSNQHGNTASSTTINSTGPDIQIVE